MKILVTGATGFVGRHLIRALHEAGHKVTGSARGTLDVSPLGMRYGWMPADYMQDTHIDDWLPRLQGQGFEVVINAVGILREDAENHFDEIHSQAPRALFAAARESGVKQVIQLSALGNGKSSYYQSKHEADDFLLGQPFKATVLRPSVIYGETGDSTRLFKYLASLPVIPLIGKGDQCLQPIHVNELCRIVAALIKQPPEDNDVIEVVGPEQVSMRDFLAEIRKGMGKGRAHFMRTPLQLAKLGARVGDLLKLPALSCQSLNMLMAGNTGNPEAITRLLGRRPYRVAEYFSDRR